MLGEGKIVKIAYPRNPGQRMGSEGFEPMSLQWVKDVAPCRVLRDNISWNSAQTVRRAGAVFLLLFCPAGDIRL